MNGTEGEAIAAAFVRARRAGHALPRFPGPLPQTLAEGYAIQDRAIEFWDARVVGWKVAALSPDAAILLGAERVCGPLFDGQVTAATTPDVAVPIPAGGYVALEPEYVVVVAADAPAHKTCWSLDEAAGTIGSLHVGIEIAGSPLATINELGPVASVSDFGTNIGLVLGPPIVAWEQQQLRCTVEVNGLAAGAGGIERIAGGPVAALRFMLEEAARRGRPLLRRQIVSTGAAGGVHAVTAGDEVSVDFQPGGRLVCGTYARGAAAMRYGEGPVA